MPQITGGRVVYGRTVQPAQYESKKAEVELTFAIEEGAAHDRFLSEVANEAIAKAHEMVGISGAGRTPTTPKPAQTGGKEAAAAKMNKADAAKPKGDGIELDPGPKRNITASPEDRKDPDGLDLDGGAQPITDTQLQEAVQLKMKEINNGKAIKAVREKYVQVPKSIKDIPQEQRAAFLADVKALTK